MHTRTRAAARAARMHARVSARLHANTPAPTCTLLLPIVQVDTDREAAYPNLYLPTKLKTLAVRGALLDDSSRGTCSPTVGVGLRIRPTHSHRPTCNVVHAQGKRIMFVAGGAAAVHCMAGDSEGNLYTWGRNEVGGGGTHGRVRVLACCISQGPQPTVCVEHAMRRAHLGSTPVLAHAQAPTTPRAPLCARRPQKGQLGHGDLVNRNNPKLVQELKGKHIVGGAGGGGRRYSHGRPQPPACRDAGGVVPQPPLSSWLQAPAQGLACRGPAPA